MATKPIFTTFTYELDFGKPVYSIVQNSISILEAFYDALSPRFGLDASSQQVTSAATALSDFALQVSLFGGSATFVIRLERFTCEIRNVLREEDFRTARDSIELAEGALTKAVPDIPIRSASVSSSAWLKVEDAESATIAALTAGQPETRFDLTRIGATRSEHWPIGNLWNDQDGWSANYRLERSSVEEADLFYACLVRYDRESKFASADRRMEHMTTIHDDILENLGLKL